jgi:hypothetical protein
VPRLNRRAFTTLAGAGVASALTVPLLARATGALSTSTATGQRCFGIVTDLLTGLPVPDAAITTSPDGQTAHTDAAGIYSLELQPGPFSLAFDAAGYIGERRLGLFLAPGEALQVDFTPLRASLTEEEQQRAYDLIVKQPGSAPIPPPIVGESVPIGPAAPAAPTTLWMPKVARYPTVTPTPTPGPTAAPTPYTLRFPVVARPPLPTPTRTPTWTPSPTPGPSSYTIVVRSQANPSQYTTLDLEEYIKGVVPNEAPSSWPAESLKAQAVAARTYGVATYLALGYVWDGTSSQVYDPTKRTATTDAATDATRGLVARYGSTIITAFFFSRCNGASTKNGEDAILWNQNCARAGWNYVAYCRAASCWGHAASTMSPCGYYGHGVGMCQWGAYSRANEGWSCAQIVSHYYTGISIQSLT